MTTPIIYVHYTHDRDVPVHEQRSERVSRVKTRVIWRCLAVGVPIGARPLTRSFAVLYLFPAFSLSPSRRSDGEHSLARSVVLDLFYFFLQPSFRWWALSRALSRVGLFLSLPAVVQMVSSCSRAQPCWTSCTSSSSRHLDGGLCPARSVVLAFFFRSQPSFRW